MEFSENIVGLQSRVSEKIDVELGFFKHYRTKYGSQILNEVKWHVEPIRSLDWAVFWGRVGSSQALEE